MVGSKARVARVEAMMNALELVEQERDGILELRRKYGAREDETLTQWISRLNSELDLARRESAALAASDAHSQKVAKNLLCRMFSDFQAASVGRDRLLEERRRVAEYLGGNPNEPLIPRAKQAVEELQQLRAQVEYDEAVARLRKVLKENQVGNLGQEVPNPTPPPAPSAPPAGPERKITHSTPLSEVPLAEPETAVNLMRLYSLKKKVEELEGRIRRLEVPPPRWTGR